MLPRHAVCATAYKSRIVNELWPPSNQTLGLQPESVFGPLSVENKNSVAGSPDRLALSPVLFLESVDGNDVPRPIFRKIPNPAKVGRIPRETIGEMDDFFYTRSDRRQLPNSVGQVTRQVVVEEELQAASLSSN